MFYHLTQLAEDRDNCVGVSVTCVKLTAQDFEYFNLYTGSSFSLGGMNGVNLLLSSLVRVTTPEKSLGTPSHFCNICLGIYQFVPFLPVQCCLIVMKLSLLLYNVVGGDGVAYSCDAIRYFPQNTLSTYFRAI